MGAWEPLMPTRRIFELVLITSLAMRPVFGMLHLWSSKTMASGRRGDVLHGAAEVAAVIS